MQLANRLILIASLTLSLSGANTAFSSEAGKQLTNSTGSNKPSSFTQPNTLAELLALPTEQLEKVDIAVMNLLCAEGLPGAEKMDVPKLLETLDAWARWVGFNTKRHYYRFQKNPGYYRNSEGDFRMAWLATTLQQQYGVRYNPERAAPQLRDGPFAEPGEVFFADSKDIFIHGLLDGHHSGTCSSMPVLFAAVGRRLGYPVHLAISKTHVWVRYHEGDGHFNVEATSPGFSVYPDSYYKEKYLPVTDEEIKTGRYLQALDGKETLALFLTLRVGCFKAANQLEKAREASAMAYKLEPHVREHKIRLDDLEAEIEGSRKATRRDALVKEISRVIPPPGEKFEYYRDRKIDLQMYLLMTADLDAFEKGIKRLKQELAGEIQNDAPARLDVSLEKSPQSVPITVVVLPEKVRYTAIDGQVIESLVKSPEHLEFFLRVQRIFDKVAELGLQNQEAQGIPEAARKMRRPTSLKFEPVPGITPETQLRMQEDDLDEMLKARQDVRSLAQILNPCALVPTAQAQEFQDAIDLINHVNALDSRQQRGGHNSFPSRTPQMDPFQQLQQIQRLQNPLRLPTGNPHR